MVLPRCRICAIAGLLLMLAACVATTTLPPRYLIRVGEEPTAGSSSEARVGDPIYVKFDYRSEEVLRLTQAVERKYPGCFNCTVSLPPGTVIEKRPASEGYCTREKVPVTARGSGLNFVCFTGHATRPEFISVRIPGTLGSWLALDAPVSYEPVEVMVGEGGFKSELVYQGVANQVLRLLYREYSENLARPAFHQELTYTMETDGPTNVGFRGLRIEVFSADNSGIRYQVVSGL